jgi:hypothetical protein
MNRHDELQVTLSTLHAIVDLLRQCEECIIQTIGPRTSPRFSVQRAIDATRDTIRHIETRITKEHP